MSESESRVRWPDGASLSVPFPYGRIGGTYYWNPGSSTAPRLTLTRSLGMPGAGLHAVFLRQGMTSNDTLGAGLGGNVSTILPSVSLNGTIPDEGDHIPRPWRSRVTTVEAGIGTPNASPAVTATYTPQQIADFLTRYVFPPPSGPEWKNAFVRDSAAGAGVASRNNVFEHGFPDSGSAPPAASEMNGDKLRPTVFDTGASPIPFSSAQSAPHGLLVEGGLIDPSGLTTPSAGGLPGFMTGPAGIDPSNGGWPAPSPPAGNSGANGGLPPSRVFNNGAPPVPYPFASQRAPRGLPAMLAEVGAFDPSNPQAPPSGGLPGLIQEYLRNH